MVEEIKSWKQLMEVLPSLGEEDLRNLINFEVSTYKRPAMIKRMHSRYGQLLLKRQRELLLKAEILL